MIEDRVISMSCPIRERHICSSEPAALIDIDVHIIPDNPSKQEGEHFHVDFAYYLTPIKQVTPSDPEMTDWFAIDDITAPRLVRVIQKLKKSTQ